MLKTGAGSSESRWTFRDWVAAAGLFVATAGVILWQNAHIAVLWDVSYVLDSAARIAHGQMPYRDFPFAHAPLTFLIQAALIRLTGHDYFHHVLYAAVVGGMGTVLTWRIALRTLRDRMNAAWTATLLLAAPLTVLGIYCILPVPSYDCDCAASVLVAVWLLQRLESNHAAQSRSQGIFGGLIAGTALCVPVFFKQNIGLPFLAASLTLVLVLLVVRAIFREQRATPASSMLLAVVAGAVATMALAALLIHLTAGIGNYIYWTIQFAAQRRLPGFADMITVYRDPVLLWTLPCVVAALLLLRAPLARSRWTQNAAIVLLAAPFLFTLYSLILYDDADERGDTLLALWPTLLILAAALAVWGAVKFRRAPTLRALFPLVLLATINGAFMSQQLWGSTYAFWPLLILLAAEMLAYLASPAARGDRKQDPALVIARVFSFTLLICGAFYTASEERLSYAQFPDGPAAHSAFPQLTGMHTPGPWLRNFDELLRFTAAKIPAADGLILLPGEDPFYFVSGRTPQFPVLLFDPATDPYSPAQVVEQTLRHNVRWLIVKRELQIKADPMPQREVTLRLLMRDFTLTARLHGYDVYRRQ